MITIIIDVTYIFSIGDDIIYLFKNWINAFHTSEFRFSKIHIQKPIRI